MFFVDEYPYRADGPTYPLSDRSLSCIPAACTRAGARSISELSQLKHEQRAKAGGLIITLQCPPTANGYAFLALEDPTELVNAVIAPQVYAQYREAIHSTFMIVDGVVQKDHGATNGVAAQVK